MTENENNEFIDLLKTVDKSLTNYTLALCKDSDEAKDIFQDTVLACYQNFDKLRDKSVFKSYIFQIAFRTYKHTNWRKRLFQRMDKEKADMILDPNMKVSLNLEVQDLYQAMNELPLLQRNAISLFEISGFSIKEIAIMQKTKESTVKSRLKRGREKLAELLEVEKEQQMLVSSKGNTNTLKEVIV